MKRIKPFQSTQQNIPVKDFLGGMVVTASNRFVKVIEVNPQPFFLKKVNEQNIVARRFQQFLKIAPNQLHIKTMSLPSDMSRQINRAAKNITNESSANCRAMGEEYIQRLYQAQRTGIERKFYISFPYEGSKFGNSTTELSDIAYDLNKTAQKLKSALAACGNSVVELNDQKFVTRHNAQLYHTIYNRTRYFADDFSARVEQAKLKYGEVFGNEDFYVPPTDLIAPSIIDYTNSKYLCIDGTYYKFLYITKNGYNPLAITGWLHDFVNSAVGVDVDIYLRRYSRDEVINKIRFNITNNKVDMNGNSEITDSYENARSSLSAAYYLKNGLSSGQDFYYVATMITVSADSPEEVDKKMKRIISLARGNDIVIRQLNYLHEQAFNHALPHVFMDDDSFFNKMKRNCLTEGVSSFYPFTSYQLMCPDGLYIADDISNRSPAILDFFESRENIQNKYFTPTNPNLCIFGQSGSGKSTAAMLMLSRFRSQIKQYTKDGTMIDSQVFAIIPEKENEFRRLTEEGIGGQFISIGSGSPHRINIMEIFKRDKEAMEMMDAIDGTNTYAEKSFLAEKISTLMDFMQLILTDINLEEKQLLNEAIIRTYDRFGITTDNDSLWADESHTDYKKMPILADLVNELEQSDETKKLARMTKALTIGVGEFFNGYTNVDVNNKFFVIGLQHCNEEMLVPAIYVALDFCWSKILQNRLQKKMFLIDEFWKFCTSENTIAMKKIVACLKLTRALNCQMCLASQQLVDLFTEKNDQLGTQILNGCATKILMLMQDNDIDIVREKLMLTDAEAAQLRMFDRGDALLFSGDIRMTIHFNPTETEKKLIFTDSKTLNEIYDEKQRKLKEEKQIKELLDFAKEFQSVTFEELQPIEKGESTYEY